MMKHPFVSFLPIAIPLCIPNHPVQQTLDRTCHLSQIVQVDFGVDPLYNLLQIFLIIYH
ncbi:MAG: hypothetical protein RLZZ333_406 [Bacteroidota bacterium]